MAARAFNPVNDLYGGWPRGVQAAYSYGVPGYVTRFSDWDEVRAMIAAEQPLVISIRTAAGELNGAPCAYPGGHLLVLAGFDRHGDVEVNDPAAASADAGMCTYSRSELDSVWLRRGGTAYVLLPTENAPPS